LTLLLFQESFTLNTGEVRWRKVLGGLYAIRRRPTRLKEWEAAELAEAVGGGRDKGRKKESQFPTTIAATSSDDSVWESTAAASGLVLERYGDRLLVELNATTTFVCCQKQKLAEKSIVVGDRVRIALLDQATAPQSDFQGVVTSHEPRTTLLQRPLPSGKGQMKAIAANVDHVVVVVCASPKVPLSSVDRILVAAHEYGMEATLVLNKIDDIEGTQALRQDLKHYPELGYRLLEVSVESGEGLESLRALLRGRCSIFVGQSGVGKSSLVNTLLPDMASQQRVGDLVKGAHIGSHTTSSARLFHLPPEPCDEKEAVAGQEGTVIDSPGIRELGVWHLPLEAIQAGFFEIAELASQCRFRNCKHDEGELGCAVQRALGEGKVARTRFLHYRELTQ
jgi:ribosome small subunit-dependent GTPase A